jgi:HAD superfamily phosphoserine phosphatase-like hydrolase
LPEPRPGPAPRTVIFDADSTLVGIEGIDWLAQLRTPDLARRVAELTSDAMAGGISLGSVYGARLAMVAPTRRELDALGAAYVGAVAPGAVALVRALRSAGIRPLIVSGGLHAALLPLGAHLGIPADDVHGVRVNFHADGTYDDFDRASLLAAQGGKAALVRSLRLARPVVAVGDGVTDLEIRANGDADAFVAYTGFVTREAVVRAAESQAGSFDALRALLLPRE